jgi:molybdate transport system substrate-binding protein
MRRACVVLAAFALATAARADSVHVAVATNFAPTARAIAGAFTAASKHDVIVSDGSSGKLAAQIQSGAPFEVFLSADAERPAKLAASGHAVGDTRFAYAVGRLALWSARPDFVKDDAVLEGGAFAHLAIANPELAPYGAAAREALQKLGLWDAVQPKLVRGEDVGQAYHFVSTGAAELGFVALAQVVAKPGGSHWVVPDDLHAPIEQHAILLATATDDAAARAFLDFLRGDAARALIERAGYGVSPRS